jgi:vacuolar-type H+-ATPase subunit E/Vma4
MAIDDILRALDEQAEADCVDIVDESREHAKLIVEEAERQARQIHDAFVHQVEGAATLNATKKVNAASFEAKMTVSSVKGDGVAAVFADARSQLSSARNSGYESLFAALAAEALSGVSGPVTVHTAPADIVLAERATAAAGLVAEVVGDLDSAGGLVVDTGGGKIIRRNTLESRLDRVTQFVRADVARVLFS